MADAWHAGAMDFDLFLRSLESEFDARRREEADALVNELADAERVSVVLAHRLASARGRRIGATLRGGLLVEGVVLDARTNWVLIDEDAGRSLIPASALVAVRGLGVGVDDHARVGAGLGISSVLRELAEERIPVVVDHDAGRCRGRILAVFGDHFDLEANSAAEAFDSRDSAPRAVLSLATAGVRRIRGAVSERG